MAAIDPERVRALAEELAELEDDIARRYRLYSRLLLEAEEPAGGEEYQALVRGIREQAQRDREENVLFQLWMRERLLRGPVDLELEEFSEVVAGRALVRLLHYVPRGEELLASLDPEDRSWIPDKAAVRRFVLSGGLAEEDSQRFLARLFSEVPRARRALYKLLGAYKAVVEVEAEKRSRPYPGLLPGQELAKGRGWSWDELARLLGFPPTLWEVELARARRIMAGIREYLAGQDLDTVRVEARERFRERLKRLGILRSPGRPKKN